MTRARILAGALGAALVAAAAVVIVIHPGHRPGGRGRDANRTAITEPGPASSAAPGATSSPTTAPPPEWQFVWGSAMAWGYGTVSDATVRSLVSVPVDGTAIRVRISNVFGNAPLVVGAASVGRSDGGAGLVAATLEPLRFSGADSVTVPAGASVLSDPLQVEVKAPETFGVSVYVEDSDVLTSHYPCCEAATPSFVSAPGSGNLSGEAAPAGFGYEAPWSRLVDAVVLERPSPPPGTAPPPGSIVVLGDSITDGFHSTTRWTAVLQERLDALPAGERPAVVNEGNTANTLTAVVPSDAKTGGGPPGVQRLGEDALDLPGVSTVVVFLGTNDLYFGATAGAVIAGFEQAARAAHAAGARIVGVTLLPRAGSEGWTPARQVELEEVNEWLLSNHVLDGVLDLATPVADMYNGACNPAAMLPAYDSGDHLHPNAAGDVAMADAVAPAVLDLPPLPQVPPPLEVVATEGCAGAPGIPPPQR